MSDDKLSIHIDSVEQHPDVPSIKDGGNCPDHPNYEPEIHYGMAGGGVGVYTYCPQCGRILGKDQEIE